MPLTQILEPWKLTADFGIAHSSTRGEGWKRRKWCADLITAVYSGDGHFKGTTSSVLTETVNPGITTTNVASSVNPSGYNQSVTFTATITPQFGGNATGSVTFFDATSILGSAAVAGNQAVLNINAVTVGAHSITAQYGGDTNQQEALLRLWRRSSTWQPRQRF